MREHASLRTTSIYGDVIGAEERIRRADVAQRLSARESYQRPEIMVVRGVK